MTTKAWGNEVKWEVRTSAGVAVAGCTGGPYSTNNSVQPSKQCCLAPGDYVFKPTDTYGDGWHGGSARVSGPSVANEIDVGLTHGKGCDSRPTACTDGECEHAADK